VLRGFGFVHHPIAILYRQVPNPNITNFCIAEPGTSATRRSSPRRCSADSAAAAREVRRVSLGPLCVRLCSDGKSCESLRWGIRVGDELTRPFSPRPPIPLDTSVARTEGYTYAAEVWGLCIVQGPVLSPRAEPLIVRFATVTSMYSAALSPGTRRGKVVRAERAPEIERRSSTQAPSPWLAVPNNSYCFLTSSGCAAARTASWPSPTRGSNSC
jgi:hypothetical protein